MKEITVINNKIVREKDKFFKAVECRPRNPKARCDSCALNDCSYLEFSDPLFCNALERADGTNIVWRQMTQEEIRVEINKIENLAAEYEKLLESAIKASKDAKNSDDIVRYSMLNKDIERQLNIYKLELAKMKKKTAMIIKSVALVPYMNGLLSIDGWEISHICEIINIPIKQLYEKLGLFRAPTKYGNICLKLYDDCEEIHSAVIEHGEFLLQVETEERTYTFKHCKDAKFTMGGSSGDDFPRLYMNVSIDNVEIDTTSILKQQ